MTAAAAAAFLVALAVNAGLLVRAHPALLDHPNDRSLHTRPIPRGGGVGIVAGALVGVGVAWFRQGEGGPMLPFLLVLSVAIAAVSFADDLRHLHPGLRLAVHAAAAAALVAAGLAPAALVLPGVAVTLAPPIGAALTMLFVVWIVNLYNFMDGMDGFAGGMAVIGFATFAVLGFAAGESALGTTALLLVGAAGGFLVFNFPPARIFMGDVGSSFLGFLAAALALWADASGAFPLWIGVLVFSPFVVDATVTLVRRLAAGERVWHAHRTHFYQRLVGAGWSHRRAVLWEYALMLACAASALAVARAGSAAQWTAIAFWTLAYAILAIMVTRLERRRRSPHAPVETV